MKIEKTVNNRILTLNSYKNKTADIGGRGRQMAIEKGAKKKK